MAEVIVRTDLPDFTMECRGCLEQVTLKMPIPVIVLPWLAEGMGRDHAQCVVDGGAC